MDIFWACDWSVDLNPALSLVDKSDLLIHFSRSRRENAGRRKTTASKFEALKKLREARDGGRKMNYEEEEVDNVYDIVEESEYAERVTKRKEEDWIVDDDGEYVEDGREIFDDEDDYQSADPKKYKERSKDKAEKAKKDKSNIKNMLLNMPKKQNDDVKIEDDALLGDILGQIKSKPKPTSAAVKKPAVQSLNTDSQIERNPFVKKGTGLKKTVIVPKTTAPAPSQQDTEMEQNVNADMPDMDDFSEEMEMDMGDMDIPDATDDSQIKDEKKPDVESSQNEMTETKSRGFTVLAEKSLGSGDTI